MTTENEKPPNEEVKPGKFSTEAVTELIKVVRENTGYYHTFYWTLRDSIFQETVTSIIGESQYAIGSVEEWSKTIAESISTSIQKYEYPGYKYVINTMLIQKSDGGVQVRWHRKTLWPFNHLFSVRHDLFLGCWKWSSSPNSMGKQIYSLFCSSLRSQNWILATIRVQSSCPNLSRPIYQPLHSE